MVSIRSNKNLLIPHPSRQGTKLLASVFEKKTKYSTYLRLNLEFYIWVVN